MKKLLLIAALATMLTSCKIIVVMMQKVALFDI